jgi:hypothetical protein
MSPWPNKAHTRSCPEAVIERVIDLSIVGLGAWVPVIIASTRTDSATAVSMSKTLKPGCVTNGQPKGLPLNRVQALAKSASPSVSGSKFSAALPRANLSCALPSLVKPHSAHQTLISATSPNTTGAFQYFEYGDSSILKRVSLIVKICNSKI